MKRKLFVIVICILLTGCLIGCSNGRKIMKEVPEKILFKSGGGLASYHEDLKSLNKLVMHSDLIVMGIVKSETYMYCDEEYGDLYTDITFKIDKVYYGDNLNNVQFRYPAGYAPIREYEKMVEHDGYLEDFQKAYSEAQRQDSYVQVKFAEENYMLPGDRFILFLQKQANNSYYPVSTFAGSIKIDGEYANQTIDGHEYKVNDVIDYISKVDYKNKEICYDCEQKRKEAIEYYKKKEKP
ncbi:hypothetical protein RBG61_12370 [Paludicola sp. MB14-C6]|uniref:hypothetical protein n=1 Tax=Paludihabitans sp. MB14-C6 TaxID=3070656 RepID=UPI0027DACFE8|nr:hypothetical protein [Paludicola sp. MB14-C6]WMJ22775.1 hypothetical protein RBG61_12370 [Paludicola sp. MB14-C6]